LSHLHDGATDSGDQQWLARRRGRPGEGQKARHPHALVPQDVEQLTGLRVENADSALPARDGDAHPAVMHVVQARQDGVARVCEGGLLPVETLTLHRRLLVHGLPRLAVEHSKHAALLRHHDTRPPLRRLIVRQHIARG
jgi:hypothetical protein